MSVVFAMSACSSSNTLAEELGAPTDLNHSYTKEAISNPNYLAFKNKMRAFAGDFSEAYIYQEFVPGENIAISPLSLELCLGLAISSSSGETRNELLRALNLDYQTLHSYYRLYIDELSFEYLDKYKEPESKLLLTNSLWVNDDISLKENGLKHLINDRYCYAYAVDFKNDNRKSNHAINRFFRDQTDGFLSPQFDFSKDALLSLFNTIYLKDIWTTGKDGLSEADGAYKFTNIDGNVSKQKLLQGQYFPGKVIETAAFSSFYTQSNKGIKIYFVKANSIQDFTNLSPRAVVDYVLGSESLVTKDDNKKEIYETNCVFPEIFVNSNISLKKVLSNKLGINRLFDSNRCDLSKLTSSSVFCEDIKQNVKLIIDKDGIEGSAVSSLTPNDVVVPEGYNLVKNTFVVDETFGYMITNSNNDILFTGIITNID